MLRKGKRWNRSVSGGGVRERFGFNTDEIGRNAMEKLAWWYTSHNAGTVTKPNRVTELT
jgi:hypothetical protein